MEYSTPLRKVSSSSLDAACRIHSKVAPTYIKSPVQSTHYPDPWMTQDDPSVILQEEAGKSHLDATIEALDSVIDNVGRHADALAKRRTFERDGFPRRGDAASRTRKR